jgi:Uri superfamily endonuclease
LALSAGKGTYLLLARFDRTTEIAVGRLGRAVLARGWYAYAGSALGPGGIRARVARHISPTKRLHWHIDYLLEESELDRIWAVEYASRLECAWADAVCQMSGARIAVPRFGASDCRCPGHLAYFSERPHSKQIHAALQAAIDERCANEQSVHALSMGD